MGLQGFEMTQSFDEWFIKASQNKLFWESPSKSSKMGYEAGAASRQAEIDKLEVEIKETQAFLNNQNHIKQTRIDELQKRIDGVLNYIGNDFDDYYTGLMVESIHNILKGKQND